jgi:anti-sigma B factor antagonist
MANSSFIESEEIEGGILVIKLHGKLDSTRTEEFQSEVRKHLESGNKRIILDCSNLGYVSSLGLGSLVALETKLRRQGGAVKLAGVQGNVAEILSLVRLDSVLGIYGDIAYAQEAFQDEQRKQETK